MRDSGCGGGCRPWRSLALARREGAFPIYPWRERGGAVAAAHARGPTPRPCNFAGRASPSAKRRGARRFRGRAPFDRARRKGRGGKGRGARPTPCSLGGAGPRLFALPPPIRVRSACLFVCLPHTSRRRRRWRGRRRHGEARIAPPRARDTRTPLLTPARARRGPSPLAPRDPHPPTSHPTHPCAEGESPPAVVRAAAEADERSGRAGGHLAPRRAAGHRHLDALHHHRRGADGAGHHPQVQLHRVARQAAQRAGDQVRCVRARAPLRVRPRFVQSANPKWAARPAMPARLARVAGAARGALANEKARATP